MPTKKKDRQRGERVAVTSTPVILDRIEAVRELVPEASTEAGLDWDKLRTALGAALDERPDRYRFEWAGKRDAISLLQQPTTATLVPVPEESVDFDRSKNSFVEGDNLEVLKLLYRAYAGTVKVIYIDPPYNTGNDFIYRDDYSQPLQAYLDYIAPEGATPSDARGEANRASRTGRIHSDWLSMMYPRLFLARQLLQDDGSIFISCDDHEVHHLRLIMNELFGEENFLTTIVWQKVYAPKNTARFFSEDHDYVVVYAANAQRCSLSLLPRSAEADARYHNLDQDKRGVWKPDNLLARNYYSKGSYSVESPSGRTFSNPTGTYWRFSKEGFDRLNADSRIWWGPDGDGMPALKRFLTEVKQGIVPQTLWSYKSVGHTQEAKKELLDYVSFEHTVNVLDTVKPTRLIQRILQIATQPGGDDLVLDFFAGSGSTAHAVHKQNAEDGGNRRCISVQLPQPLETPESQLRTIADIAKVRLREVARRMNASAEGQLSDDVAGKPTDLGFALFRVEKSNFRVWEKGESQPEPYLQSLELFQDPLAAEWDATSVIYEVAIKEAGMSLASRITRLEALTTNTVYRVTDHDQGRVFHVCLDSRVDPATPKELPLRGEGDLFVCRDCALDDTLAANLALQCRLRTI